MKPLIPSAGFAGFAGLATIALGALALATSASASTNLVVNGYFSQPDPGTYNMGGWNQAASIPGWTSNTTDTIETGLNSTYGLSSYNGSTTNLELNDNTWGSVTQDVTGLVAGDTYNLTFGYGTRGGAGPEAMTVNVGGVDLGTLNSPANGSSSWASEYFSFVATGASEDLTFTSLVTAGSPAEGNELTDVSISAVPEPNAWALMLAGFAGLGAALRLSRRNAGVASA